MLPIKRSAVIELVLHEVPDFPKHRELIAQLARRRAVGADAWPDICDDVAAERESATQHNCADPAGTKANNQERTGQQAALENLERCSHTCPLAEALEARDESSNRI